jgi:hypothetical protein
MSLPQPSVPVYQKAKLVNLGLYALSRGEWQMVAAITRLIKRRGWMHA